MKKNSVLGNLVLVILLNVLVKPGWILFVDRVVQNQNGNIAFGNYGKYLSLSFVFSIILDLGISNLNQKNVATEENAIRRDFYPFMKSKSLLALVYLLWMHLLFWVSGFPASEYLLFLSVCFIQIATSMSLFIRSNASGLHLFRLDSWLSVLDKFVALVICVTIIYGLGRLLDVTSYAMIQFLGFFSVIVVGLIYLRSYLKSSAPDTHYGWDVFMRSLRRAAPYALVVFFMSLYHRLDYFLIAQYAPGAAADAGRYMAAYRIVDIVTMAAFLIANILLPYFARQYEKGEDIAKPIHFFSILMGSLSIPISAYLFYYSDPLCQFLYVHDSHISAQQLHILALSLPALYLNYIYSSFLTAADGVRTLVYISLIAAAVFLLSTRILLPSIGLISISWTSTALYFALLVVYISVMYFRYGVGPKPWLQLALTAVVFFGGLHFIQPRMDFISAGVVTAFIGLGCLVFLYFQQKEVISQIQTEH